jgi:hypothetical protein
MQPGAPQNEAGGLTQLFPRFVCQSLFSTSQNHNMHRSSFPKVTFRWRQKFKAFSLETLKRLSVYFLFLLEALLNISDITYN